MGTFKARFKAKIPAALRDGTAIIVRKDGLAYYFDIDFTQFSEITSFDPSAKVALVYDASTREFGLLSITSIISSAQTQQVKTAAGDVNVAATDGLIIINKTVGGATTVTLPASGSKIGPVKVADWKGDAGTNAITVALTGADKLNGNLTTWTIGADGASAVFTPLASGAGYAV